MNKNKFINGPINVARIEGKINDVDKVLYLFMDYHMNPNNQTVCNDIDNTDVDKYLFDTIKSLKSTGKTYDFFYESMPTELYNFDMKYKNRYIESVGRMLIKVSNDKSKAFDHIRFHYIDIRDYLEDNMIVTNVIKELDNLILKELMLTNYTIDNYVNNYIKLKNNILDTIKILKNPKKHKHGDVKVYNKKNMQNILDNFIYKIKNVYDAKHKNIKDTINIYFKKIIDDFDAYVEHIDEILSTLSKIKNEIQILPDERNDVDDNITYGLYPLQVRSMIYDIVRMSEQISFYHTFLYAKIIDIYMIRRFLDKDYITNAVSYTGIFHSSHIIYILIKYFNFKLTNIVYSDKKYKNIDEINTTIKKSNNLKNVLSIIYPHILYQCSNIKDFPINFE